MHMTSFTMHSNAFHTFYNVFECISNAFNGFTMHLTRFRMHSNDHAYSAGSTMLLSPVHYLSIFEPPRGKTNNLHMRKQRRRSASR